MSFLMNFTWLFLFLSICWWSRFLATSRRICVLSFFSFILIWIIKFRCTSLLSIIMKTDLKTSFQENVSKRSPGVDVIGMKMATTWRWILASFWTYVPWYGNLDHLNERIKEILLLRKLVFVASDNPGSEEACLRSFRRS